LIAKETLLIPRERPEDVASRNEKIPMKHTLIAQRHVHRRLASTRRHLCVGPATRRLRRLSIGRSSILGLSSEGDDVRYQSLTFNVSAAGTYDFLSVASSGLGTNFLLLYSPSFSPGSPLNNGLVGNDDLGGIGTAGFSRN
jgi:hypothetical protein